MIAQYHGMYCPVPVLAELCEMGTEGVSLLGLSRAAEAIGFQTMALEVSLEVIEEENLAPFIAHWSERHFLVVYEVSDDRVWVADPARGLLELGREEFLVQWAGGGNGIALLLEPGPGLPIKSEL
jgi:ATP-binding cassette subfamily B protein